MARLDHLIVCFLAFLVLPVRAEEIGDAALGAKLFEKNCKVCHQVGENAVNKIGPHLNSVYGRKAGSDEKFKYSKSMTRMGADGLTWTLETLDAYIENPKALVSGTRMSFRGVKDINERHAILAFLRNWSDKPQNIPEAEPTALKTDPDLAPEVLAIKGDVDYGAYLASECQTCHQVNGTDQGIPAINGWPEEDFVVAMHSYKMKLRPHPVMQMMAGRLNDQEIAALAAYFATLE